MRFSWLALNVLNLADALLTLSAVALGATELNPLMGLLLGAGAFFFVAVKVLVVLLGSTALRTMGFGRVLAATAIFYGGVVAFEAFKLSEVLR